MSHEEIEQLLGAYAVNALDPAEKYSVEQHLQTCALCMAEVDEMREVTAQLGTEPSLQPDELWDRIEAQLVLPAPTQPLMEPVFRKRRTARQRVLTSVGSVAAVLLIVIGSTVAIDHNRSSSSNPLLAAASKAESSSDAFTVEMKSSNSSASATAVLLPDGSGYLKDFNLPALPAGRTYEFWTIRNEVPLASGTLGTSPTVAAFTAKDGMNAIAITVEPKGGSVSPTTNPLVLASL